MGRLQKSKNACLTLHHLGSNFSMVVIGLNRGVSSKFLTIIELGVLPDVNNSFSTLVTIAVSPFQIRVKHSSHFWKTWFCQTFRGFENSNEICLQYLTCTIISTVILNFIWSWSKNQYCLTKCIKCLTLPRVPWQTQYPYVRFHFVIHCQTQL